MYAEEESISMSQEPLKTTYFWKCINKIFVVIDSMHVCFDKKNSELCNNEISMVFVPPLNE